MLRLRMLLCILNRPVIVPLWSFFGVAAGLILLVTQSVFLDAKNDLMEANLLQMIERLEAIEAEL